MAVKPLATQAFERHGALDFRAGERLGYDAAFEVEQFLFEEAALLDERRYAEWYDLLADDLFYFMPARYTVSPRDTNREFAPPGETAHFEDDKAMMRIRVKRLESNLAWAESPPSRTRRHVSGVVVRGFPGHSEIMARSNVLIYKGRHDADIEIVSVGRFDVLRPSAERFEIVSRKIVLDQTVLLTSNLSFFI